jgi:hypothetical protein
MTTAPSQSSSHTNPSELVAGFLAVLSIVASALALFYQPVKLSVFAILIALISVGLAPRGSRLPLIACIAGGIGFFAGMTIAVTTGHSLY